MSKEPSQNPDAVNSEDELAGAQRDVAGDDVRIEASDPALPLADDVDDNFAEEEFSLDQLSQAYAEVLKGRTDGDADEQPDPVDSTENEDTDNVPFEKNSPEVDNAACPISPESIIESILFVGAPKGVKLNSRKVAAVLRDVSPKEVTKIVRELNEKYEKEDSAYRIKSDGGVFQMVLDPKLLDFQQDFFGRNRQVRLSQAAIDVMAIVAYNQPATRDQVDKIRAKPSGSVLSQLVRRQLLFVEPGETDPKIRYYATTDRFLDLFSLEEIADLPQSHDVSDIEELAD
jgi:segregation and condensation protein B